MKTATAFVIAVAMLFLRCAPPPPPRSRPVLHPPLAAPLPRIMYDLPIHRKFTLESKRPLALWFRVPPGETLFLGFALHEVFEYRYVLSLDGEKTINFDYLQAPRDVTLPGIPAGLYELKVMTSDRLQHRIWLSIETLPQTPPSPPPRSNRAPAPPAESRVPDRRAGRRDAPRPTDRRKTCAWTPNYADEIEVGTSVNGMFGTKGKHAERWLAFSIKKSMQAEAVLTIKNAHPMRLVIVNEKG